MEHQNINILQRMFQLIKFSFITHFFESKKKKCGELSNFVQPISLTI